MNIVIGFSVYTFRWGLISNSQLSTLDQSHHLQDHCEVLSSYTFLVYLGGLKRGKIFKFLRGESREAKERLNLVGFEFLLARLEIRGQ